MTIIAMAAITDALAILRIFPIPNQRWYQPATTPFFDPRFFQGWQGTALARVNAG
jgi:hypothetical protein